jgi:hypothetical protein
VLARPERLIGIHFFNPVAKMPLVEVVAAEGADPEMLQRGTAFVRQIDRLPLPVKSAPGFLVNAVLGPYMLEAMRAVDEGLAPETVDEAMLAFGMPMGPIELVDMVGLDVAMAAGKSLAGAGAEPPKCLLERFNAGTSARRPAGASTSTAGPAGQGRGGACRRVWPRAWSSRCSSARSNWSQRRDRCRRRSGRRRSHFRYRLRAVYRRTAQLPEESAWLTSSAVAGQTTDPARHADALRSQPAGRRLRRLDHGAGRRRRSDSGDAPGAWPGDHGGGEFLPFQAAGVGRRCRQFLCRSGRAPAALRSRSGSRSMPNVTRRSRSSSKSPKRCSLMLQ